MFLFFIGLLALAYYMGKNSSGGDLTSKLTQRNREWAEFIASYRRVAKSTLEKSLINRMLKDMSSQGLEVNDLITQESKETESETDQEQQQETPRSQQVVQQVAIEHSQPVIKSSAQIKLDNASHFCTLARFCL